jgi:choline dehydrogenase
MAAHGDSFDYVIVGAGSAGSLLAARLAERPGTRVCLLEAGPRDTSPFIGIPAGFLKVIFDPKVTWGFQAEPGPAIDDRAIPALQGRVVGGSGAINGMVYVRGQADDFNHWAQLGNPGWGYADVLPYFRRMESHALGDSEWHGDEGRVPIADLRWKNPLVDAFLASAQSLGIPANPDYNGETQEGAGTYQYNIDRGRRKNTARTYLHPQLRRGGIDLRTDARASEILFEGRRAVGIRYLAGAGREVREVRATREVILCGGAINTPRLLQVSGVGDPELLRSIGAPLVHALPGVGRNLRDHYTPRTVVRVKGATTINDVARGPRLLAEGARWLLGQPSILGIGVILGQVFWKSDPALDRPDILVTFTPGSFKEGFLGKLDDVPGMTLGTWQLRPQSSGHVAARSRDMFEAPAIQPNYLAEEGDRRVLLAGQKLVRRLLGQPALARHVEEEIIPGAAVQTDDELMSYARRQGLAGYHYCGTCKMGPDGDRLAVVDAALRVRGIEGLRVVDASVMPHITSGNTNAPTMMIAEKAADLIGR